MSRIINIRLFTIFLVIAGCGSPGNFFEDLGDDTITVPIVSTGVIESISSFSAASGGNVKDDGGAVVSVRGICWSTGPTPTVALSTKTASGYGTGTFNSVLSGLNPNTTYYVRAYATNHIGTAYGEEISFTTLQVIDIPTLSTTGITNITQTSATSGGSVSLDGGANVTARGVCWKTSPGPTVFLTTKTSDGNGTGNYVSSINGLNANTTYYVRAYATNSLGTAYGAQVSFTTSQNPSTPILTTDVATNITQTTATGGGVVTSDGGASVTLRGVCWSTSANPTVVDSKTADGSGTGSFTSAITGLTAGTMYFIRAYATNSIGTGYGVQVAFATVGDGSTVTDIDGNIYHTVTIGSQVWMIENLRTTRYRNGVTIPNVTDNGQWAADANGAYCNYNNDGTNVATYGRLYNWYAATNVNNIAPAGWHVPTDTEWATLTAFLGGESIAGGKLKEAGFLHWVSPNTGATNETGFTDLPGGYRHPWFGTFDLIGTRSIMWSTNEFDAINGRMHHRYFDSANMLNDINPKSNGISVRCIKD